MGQWYEEGNVLTHEKLCNKFGVNINVLYYNKIIHCLQKGAINNDVTEDMKDWKNIVRIMHDKPNDKTLGKKLYNYIEKKDYRNVATFKEFLEEIKYFNLLRQAGYNESHFGALHRKANEKYKNMKLDD